MRVRRGHRGCTKGAHQTITDARVGSMVRVRVRHVIDRGASAQSVVVKKGGGGEEEVKEKIVQDARS